MFDLEVLAFSVEDQYHFESLRFLFERRETFVNIWDDGDDRYYSAIDKKSVYKPKDLMYALSVRTKGDPVGDVSDVVDFFDDGWLYTHRLESELIRDSFVNDALFRCFVDFVPVAVLIKLQNWSGDYYVLGLGYIVRYDVSQGVCDIVSVDSGLNRRRRLRRNGKWGEPIARKYLIENGLIDVQRSEQRSGLSVDERRVKKLQKVLSRKKQAYLRRELMAVYEGMCVVSGCRVAAVLEAAHIVPVSDGGEDVVSNALLLRVDLHRLFDAGLIAFYEDDGKLVIYVHSSLGASEYYELNGKNPFLNDELMQHVDIAALEIRFDECYDGD